MLTKEKLSWFAYRFVFVFAIIVASMACFSWYQVYTNNYNLNTVLISNSAMIAVTCALLVLTVLLNMITGVKRK